MAYEIPVLTASFPAGVDLSASQYTAVVLNGTAQAIAPAAGVVPLGVVQNTPTSGQTASVMLQGITKALYGAAVTAGQSLMVNATGQFIPWVTGNIVAGLACESGASGELHSVFLQ